MSGLISGPESRALACWYDIVELPDSRVLLTIGEAGGAERTPAVQRLRHAAVAYGLIGLTPGALLTTLNMLSCRLDPGRTTAVTITVVDPSTKTATWAAAGQGALILCQDGQPPQVQPGALGLPVGATDGLTYVDNELSASHGDRIVLYTEGLLTGPEAGLAEVLGALLSSGRSDPAEILAELRHRLAVDLQRELCLVTGTIE